MNINNSSRKGKTVYPILQRAILLGESHTIAHSVGDSNAGGSAFVDSWDWKFCSVLVRDSHMRKCNMQQQLLKKHKSTPSTTIIWFSVLGLWAYSSWKARTWPDEAWKQSSAVVYPIFQYMASCINGMVKRHMSSSVTSCSGISSVYCLMLSWLVFFQQMQPPTYLRKRLVTKFTRISLSKSAGSVNFGVW